MSWKEDREKTSEWDGIEAADAREMTESKLAHSIVRIGPGV
jgi:hypothetical protein